MRADSQLLLNSQVHFAGYKVPHPLEARFVMSVQTDGTITPWQAMNQACAEVIGVLGRIRDVVSAETRTFRSLQDNAYEEF
jgi:DNA-directed RNA polymerase II subunit RPB11